MIDRRELLTSGAAAALAAGLPGTARAQAPDAALDDLARDLETHASGQLIRPGQPGHEKIKFYNGRFDCVNGTTYIRPAGAEAVAKVIAWAKSHKRTFGIRGTGHSFEGRSSHPDLVIDMSHLTKLSLKSDGTLQVGAGVLLGEIYKTLNPAERILPAGSCPTVGVVGHALGGGLGDFLPMYGYCAQSIESVTLVTMGGSILKATDGAVEALGGAPMPGALKPAELMKVLRGGGQGSLGVVTDMTFKTHDVGDTTILSFKIGDAALSAARMAAIIQTWMAWREGQSPAMQAQVSSRMNLGRAGNTYNLDIAGLIVVPKAAPQDLSAAKKSVNWMLQMPEFKTRELSQPLNAAAAVKTFLDDDETTHNPARKNLYGSSSALPSALTKPALQHLIATMEASTFCSMYTSGGKGNTGPATSLHRTEFLVEWSIYSARPSAAHHKKIRALSSEVIRLAGFKDTAFPNYPDRDARDYYPNRAEIEAMRKLLDPDGLSTSSLLTAGLARAPDGTCA
jgi:FAD/FMN-containing dehydrogenase